MGEGSRREVVVDGDLSLVDDVVAKGGGCNQASRSEQIPSINVANEDGFTTHSFACFHLCEGSKETDW